jgi:hypothetical protein
MEHGLYIVTSDCARPAERAAYIDWYRDVHFADLLSVDGFKRARLFETNEDGGPEFAAVYDLEAATVNDAMAGLSKKIPDMISGGRISDLLQKRWGRSFTLRAERR